MSYEEYYASDLASKSAPVIVKGRRMDGKSMMRTVAQKLEERLERMKDERRKERRDEIGRIHRHLSRRDVGGGSHPSEPTVHKGVLGDPRDGRLQSKEDFVRSLRELDEQIMVGLFGDVITTPEARRMMGFDVHVSKDVPEGTAVIFDSSQQPLVANNEDGSKMVVIGTPFERRGVSEELVRQFRETSQFRDPAEVVNGREKIPMKRDVWSHIDRVRGIDAMMRNGIYVAQQHASPGNYTTIKLSNGSAIHRWISTGSDHVRPGDLLMSTAGGLTNKFECNLGIRCRSCIYEKACHQKRKLRRTLARVMGEKR